MKKKSFDIAFSFSVDDQWIAKDLFEMLIDAGLNIYFSSEDQDFAGGFLRKSLMDVYQRSTVNVLFWSQSYDNKTKDSIVSLERNIIWQRHVGKSEHNSLFILKIDDSDIPVEFESCLIHSIKDIGLRNAKKFIINRLIECFNVDKPLLKELAHPANCGVGRGSGGHRGKMVPCKFRLSCNFKQDGLKRWRLLGDVLAVPLEPQVSKKLKTFLIPSAQCPPFLSHSILIKSQPRALSIKQSTSSEFVKEYRRKDLKGVLFYIEKDGMEYPHLYCYEYDLFLIENWQKYLNS